MSSDNKHTDQFDVSFREIQVPKNLQEFDLLNSFQCHPLPGNRAGLCMADLIGEDLVARH